jgi:4-hydroxy-tetrahydrodipicolinate reductase
MRALLVGAGKMGKTIASVLAARGHSVVREIDLGGRPTAADRDSSDVAFEFTEPSSAEGCVVALLELGIPVVSGTTGWDPAAAREVAAAKGVPFLHSANFSLGIAAARRAVAAAAKALAPFPAYEPGMVERHHSAKKDAPSGTAKLLAREVEAARPGAPAVPIVALRHGGQPGEHAVIFEGPDEALEIVHRARSRALFAAGAVAAAEWLVASRPSGPVSFDDFLDAALTPNGPPVPPVPPSERKQP